MRATLLFLLVAVVLVVLVAFPGCGGDGKSNLTAADTAAKPVKPPPPPPPPALAGKLVGTKSVGTNTSPAGVYIMDPDGTDKVKVDTGGLTSAECWSQPDAALILLTGLFTVPRTGGNPTMFVADDEPGLPVGTGSVTNSQADWSCDGGKVAFVRYWYEDLYNRHAIAVKDWPNGPARLITSGGPGFRDVYPTWSPDGQYVMFCRIGGSPYSQLMVVAADGSGEPYLVRPDSTGVTGTSDWYRDPTTGENWIVYDGASSYGLSRLKVDAAGHALGEPIPVPDGGYSSYYRWPCWSPDGTHIAFCNVTDTKKGPVYATHIVEVATGTLHQVGDLGGVDWAAQ